MLPSSPRYHSISISELFRTGPRPRRKGPASTTASSSNSLQILRHQKQQQQQLLRQQEELVGDCGNALDETNGSTVMTDFRGPTSPANGTVYKEENIYKQLNNGHGKEGWVAVGDGRGAEKAEKFSEDESYLQHPESSKISSERREAYIDEAFSDSKRSFVQPVPEPPIYNNFSSARQVPGNSSLPAPSSPWLQPAEFDPGDIPEIDDSSPLKTSSTLSSTMITATNTTNAATIMPTSASKNIKRDQTPVRGSSSGGGSSIVDESSHVSTLTKDLCEKRNMFLPLKQPSNKLHNNPSKHPNKHKPQHLQQQQHHQQQISLSNVKNNRRYSQIHRFLPFRMIKCLSQEPERDESSGEENMVWTGSRRMAASSHTNSNSSRDNSDEFNKWHKNQGMGLTYGIFDEGDYIEQIRHVKPGTSFRPSCGKSLMLHEHTCMLPPPPSPAPISPPHTHECLPADLHLDGLQSRARLTISAAPKSLQTPIDHEIRLSPSQPDLPAHVHIPRVTAGLSQNHSLFSRDHHGPTRQISNASKIPTFSKRVAAGTPSCASSDSMPLSTLTDQIISGFQRLDNSMGTESCSQCSLQLGDTAETIFHDDLRLSSDRDMFFDTDTDKLPTLPRKQESNGDATGQPNPHYSESKDILCGEADIDCPPSCVLSPLSPPGQAFEPTSSFLLSSCSPDLQKLLQPTLTNNNLRSTCVQQDSQLYNQLRANSSDHQTQVAGVRDDISALRVDIADPEHRATLRHKKSPDRFKISLGASKPSRSKSPQSVYSDTQYNRGKLILGGTLRKDTHSPVSSTTTPAGRTKSESVVAHQKNGMIDCGDSETPMPASAMYPIKSATPVSKPMITSSSCRELEDLMSISPRGHSSVGPLASPSSKNTKGTSDDSGRSTLPHSPNISPRGAQQKTRPSALGDIGSHCFPETSATRGNSSDHRAGFSRFSPPVVTQTFAESKNDSPTPSMCDDCERERELLQQQFHQPPSSISMPRTPGSYSQISSMSGVETSV